MAESERTRKLRLKADEYFSKASEADSESAAARFERLGNKYEAEWLDSREEDEFVIGD